MTSALRPISRRSFLAATAVAPLVPALQGSGEYRFRYDHVVGTSLDLVIRARTQASAVSADHAVMTEIARLSAILSTRDPHSEISTFRSGRSLSPELQSLLAAYEEWEHRTSGALSIHPGGQGTPWNVDALGKAFIIDRAIERARGVRGVESALVNIGGDIALSGGGRRIGVTDPRVPFDNAPPLTSVVLQSGAIATSGSYTRARHLLDPRTGRPVDRLSSATVVAPDAVTANALATASCIAGADTGLMLVDRMPGASALFVTSSGDERRTSGFVAIEQAPIAAADPAGWPNGFRLTLKMTLVQTSGRAGLHRPYVGVWAENASNKMVRILAFWANERRYYTELSILFNRAGRSQDRLHSVARATRAPGAYELMWDGLDDQGAPVPSGAYKITVETNQEGGSYAKQSGIITCGDQPAEISLPASVNVEPISIRYGPARPA